MRSPAEAALSIPTVKHASLRQRDDGSWAGTVYDESVGIEFDVRQVGSRWNVNDDAGRDYRSIRLRRALKTAIKTNA